jgi:signal recognition particle receptor subunit beta
MVFFNYATMQMAAKIVYYGPGLCGKTTNLHVIYSRTAPNSRGEMVSLETETDRTLFFDLLPLDVGIIGGFKTRLQLYTVPGQVFYNTTRKLVLKGVDGIVFVADSQRPMLDPNRESLKNLRENLAEIGVSLDEIPRVFQYNKRDLANVLTIDELNDGINADRSVEWYEASATNAVGVFETLKAISKLTLKSLRSRMSGVAKRPMVVATPASSPAIPPFVDKAPPAAKPAARIATQDADPAPAIAAAPPSVPSGTMQRLSRFAEVAASDSSSKTAKVAVEPVPPEPVAAPPPPPATFATMQMPAVRPASVPQEASPRTEDGNAEISFGEDQSAQTSKPAVEPAMKHVRLRSNVDILSELDKLRKISTQKPSSAPGGASAKGGASGPRVESMRTKSPSSPGISFDDLLNAGLNHKKDIARSFDVGVSRDEMNRSRQVTIALRFSDGTGAPVASEKSFAIELASLEDIQRLLLSLKFNVKSQ